jgi:hypothetical protein
LYKLRKMVKQKIKIEEQLYSARNADVIAALKMLKENGDVNILPLLFNVLQTNHEQEVQDEIIYILNNLKIKAAAPVIANALSDPDYLSIRKTLTSACWQNGLDYKEFLPVFVDLVVQEDWETGFEAFTVIENMTGFPSEEILENERNKIHAALKNADEQRKYFLHEMLTLLR